MSEWPIGARLPDGELRVWLDDLLEDRAAPPGWVHVTSAHAAIELIDTGRVIELSLDHDLGDDEIADRGVDVVDHIAERQVIAGLDLWPRDGITIHSANPAGRDQMARTIERYASELHPVHRSLTRNGQPHFAFLERITGDGRLDC
jgi:NAD+-processing family protein with receiver domain